MTFNNVIFVKRLVAAVSAAMRASRLSDADRTACDLQSVFQLGR